MLKGKVKIMDNSTMNILEMVIYIYIYIYMVKYIITIRYQVMYGFSIDILTFHRDPFSRSLSRSWTANRLEMLTDMANVAIRQRVMFEL